jgi:hypothetical protein
LIYEIAVIDVSWRLGAHQAPAIATLGKKQNVMIGVVPVENPQFASTLVNTYDVSRREIAKLRWNREAYYVSRW